MNDTTSEFASAVTVLLGSRTASSDPTAQEIAPLSVPDVAPELWWGRSPHHEDAAQHFRRVWAKYLPVGLTLLDVQRLDPKLHGGIACYRRDTGKEWPKDLRMITRTGRLAILTERYVKGGVEALTPEEFVKVARHLHRRDRVDFIGPVHPVPSPQALPSGAPELWPGLSETDEDVPAFVRRVYGPFIPSGLRLRHIRALDRSLFDVIQGYESLFRKSWPDDLKQLWRAGRIQSRMRRFRENGACAVTPRELFLLAERLAQKPTPK